MLVQIPLQMGGSPENIYDRYGAMLLSIISRSVPDLEAAECILSSCIRKEASSKPYSFAGISLFTRLQWTARASVQEWRNQTEPDIAERETQAEVPDDKHILELVYLKGWHPNKIALFFNVPLYQIKACLRKSVCCLRESQTGQAAINTRVKN